MGWFHLWLYLHILAVIAAFGPTFTFGPISRMIRKNPQHAVFGTEIIEFIETKMTIPLAVLVPLFGAALIFTAPGNIDLWKSEWLIASIVLYILAFSFALFVQTPNVGKMLRLLRSMPPPPSAPASASPGGGAPSGAPMGPPPAVAELGKRLQLGGMFLSLMVVVILVLMVWRPGNCQGIC